MPIKRYVLLDRDGTMIIEREYLAHPDGVELLPKAAEGIRKLQATGFGLVVITNQSGIGRGYFDEAGLAAIHARMCELLAQEQITIDGIYYCPHTVEDACDCRKPRPGLALQAAGELGFDASQAFVIGDKALDVELADAIGAVSVLVRTGYGAAVEKKGTCRPDFVVDDLAAAADAILQYVAR
ncbi:MAG: D-glycero-beta-D-manno-heptose-1,7-bisphosphate 7-phosphatase [Pirellula sp.]|nr:D-glycero-beta-D-manno-heptose-1,7-bisphosphate 7-phosphatase [Pirellula sp.]